jgi:hypothetical protein
MKLQAFDSFVDGHTWNFSQITHFKVHTFKGSYLRHCLLNYFSVITLPNSVENGSISENRLTVNGSPIKEVLLFWDQLTISLVLNVLFSVS